MPAVNLSPLFNAQQLFTTAGTPLVGGLINTYLAGSATPATTYTDSGGTTPNSNPIVLDAAGLLPSEVWLVNAQAYKFVVTDSLGANARTYDNITASLASSTTGTAFAATSNTVSFSAQLLAVGGFNGYQINNQAGTRVADFMFWGSSSAPLYGMAAGSAGLNTPAGVPLSFGTNDTVRMSLSASSNDIIAQGLAITRSKAANTSRSSTTTLTDDPDLIAPLGTGRFSFEALLPIGAQVGGGGNGFKTAMAFTGTHGTADSQAWTSDAALGLTNIQPLTTVETLAAIGTTGTTPINYLLVKGFITVSVAGNLSVQWAQNSSGTQTLTMYAGAYLNCTKVA